MTKSRRLPPAVVSAIRDGKMLAIRAGAIQIGTKTIPIRAVHTRSESLKDRISEAYLFKYNTPGSVKYARDLGGKRSRDATVELIPVR